MDDNALRLDGDAVEDEPKDALLGFEGGSHERVADGGAEILQALKEADLLLTFEVKLLELVEA